MPLAHERRRSEGFLFIQDMYGARIEAQDCRCRLVIPIIHFSAKLSYHRSVRVFLRRYKMSYETGKYRF